MHKFIIFVILLVNALGISYAQEQSSQVSIMLIPKTDIDTENTFIELKKDINKRAIFTSIQNEIKKCGGRVIDIFDELEKYESSNSSNLKNDLDVEDFKYESGANIFIEPEIQFIDLNNGEKNIKISLSAKHRGETLANMLTIVGPVKSNNIASVVDETIKKDIDVFFSNIKNNYNEFLENGYPYSVEIESEAFMDNKTNSGNMISEEIELWMKENSYKSNYNITVSNIKCLVFNIRIPLEKRPMDITRGIYRFLNDNGVTNSTKLGANKISVKINKN